MVGSRVMTLAAEVTVRSNSTVKCLAYFYTVNLRISIVTISVKVDGKGDFSHGVYLGVVGSIYSTVTKNGCVSKDAVHLNAGVITVEIRRRHLDLTITYVQGRDLNVRHSLRRACGDGYFFSQSLCNPDREPLYPPLVHHHQRAR